MKSGSSSAVAFGRVLKAVRKRSLKNQADIADSFDPKLSVAAVSMAEGGNRPPKTEVAVRGYAVALELDEDALVLLWWAMQGMIGIDMWAEDLAIPRWWRDSGASPQADLDHHHAVAEAAAKWTPNDEWYPPSLELLALAEAINKILMRLLGDSWKVTYRPEMGLREPIDGRLAAVIVELREADSEVGGSKEPSEPIARFACPEPAARPVSLSTTKPNTNALSPDVAWILSAIEAMPARERAAVAGFIRGLREGASLFAETSRPPT